MALSVIIAKTTPKATPKTPLNACLTVSFIASRTTTSTTDTARAAIADMCRSLLSVKMVTKSRPGSTVSTMPRTPPNASNSAASVTARASSASVVSSVGLSSDVTGYSRPRGLSSYFGLKSTRRP